MLCLAVFVQKQITITTVKNLTRHDGLLDALSGPR